MGEGMCIHVGRGGWNGWRVYIVELIEWVEGVVDSVGGIWCNDYGYFVVIQCSGEDDTSTGFARRHQVSLNMLYNLS